jgi:hypothetical protein
MQTEIQPVSANLDTQSAVSWAAIAAGAVAAAALMLLLVALGAGLGLSAISPWSDSGVSATTFKVGTGIYLVCVAVMSSAVGGYLAARLRTKWIGVHTNEVFFRDTAHGFLAWAFAALLSAAVLGPATARLAGAAASGVGGAATGAAQTVNPSQIYVDKLFRSTAGAQPATGTPNASTTPAASGNANPDASRASRGEILRLWTSSFHDSQDLSASDKTYVARVVAGQTGMSQADAEKRVNDVVVEAKAAADAARKAAAQLSFWLVAAMFFGAFAASLAAVEGGSLRDGSWNGRVLVPRTM